MKPLKLEDHVATTLQETMQHYSKLVAEKMKHRPKFVRIFEQCFGNTLETTLFRLADSSTFVITGDIPATWLRESDAKVRTYLAVASRNEDMAGLIEGVIRRQIMYILHDPYANAFNRVANGKRTAHRYIWHIALIMQSLTSTSSEEKDHILNLLEATDADTGYMHEGFHAENPHEYTRPWFSWANYLFCELVLRHCGVKMPE